jgi:cytoskeleton protein RodZ
MIETAAHGPVSGFGAVAAAPGQGLSPGAMLRHAREASGLHAATLAISLKVPLRKLEALEGDRFDELPDAVFVRALAASVCRTLKIDPAPVLQLLPATMGPRLAASEGGINAPFRSPRDAAGPTWRDQLSRPVVLIVFALLVGALVLIVLPARQDEVASAPAPAVVPPPPEEAAPALVAEPVLASLTSPVPAAGGPGTPAAEVAPVPAPAVGPLAVAPAPLVDGIVVFRAKAPSWIQVTDARGAVALRKLLAAGESAGASGALPLAVTVGSVSVTDVEVRGKPYDLAPVSRDNVARFEVK